MNTGKLTIKIPISGSRLTLSEATLARLAGIAPGGVELHIVIPLKRESGPLETNLVSLIEHDLAALSDDDLDLELRVVVSLDENGAIPGTVDLTAIKYIASSNVSFDGVVSEVHGNFTAVGLDCELPVVKVFKYNVTIPICEHGLPEGVERIEGVLDISNNYNSCRLPSTLKYVRFIVGLDQLLSDGFPEGLEYGSDLSLMLLSVVPAKNMHVIGNLDMYGRKDITEWPEGLKVDGWVDIRGTGIKPESVPAGITILNPIG